MRWLRSERSKTHRVVVYHFPTAEGEGFSAECECGWSSSPHPRPSDALRDAYRHDAHVLPEIEEAYGGGIYPWQCCFCGAIVEESPESPICIRLNWMEDDAGQEKWYEEWCGAHRECLIQHGSKDLPPRPPLFGV